MGNCTCVCPAARPSPRCSTGTIANAAICPGGRQGRRKPDPYGVWLGEIMLQQTTVKAVIPYYQRFLARWPTVDALAAAALDDVLAAWAGLATTRAPAICTNARRRSLRDHGGRFPATEAELLRAARHRALHGGGHRGDRVRQPATPVDGNIERVMARLFAVRQPLPAAKARDQAPGGNANADGARSGDFAQAMMDLGATICTPKRPSCLMCPLQAIALPTRKAIEEQLPMRAREKPSGPRATASPFWRCAKTATCCCGAGRRRDCWAACWKCLRPIGRDDCRCRRRRLRAAPVQGDWWAVPGTVVHVFTHFRLEMHGLSRHRAGQRRH